MTAVQPVGGTPPEQGQLVELRNRLWLVQDVTPAENGQGDRATRVDLECLDDDRLSEGLSVIWEREVNTKVLLADALPMTFGRPEAALTEPFGRFRSAVHRIVGAQLDQKIGRHWRFRKAAIDRWLGKSSGDRQDGGSD